MRACVREELLQDLKRRFEGPVLCRILLPWRAYESLGIANAKRRGVVETLFRSKPPIAPMQEPVGAMLHHPGRPCGSHQKRGARMQRTQICHTLFGAGVGPERALVSPFSEDQEIRTGRRRSYHLKTGYDRRSWGSPRISLRYDLHPTLTALGQAQGRMPHWTSWSPDR